MKRVNCACGGVIQADPADPTDAVAAHNRTWIHRRWRGEAPTTKPCDGYQSPCAVTIPADRDLCHYCRRTRELVERVARMAA